jgi:hypothetical protein
MLLLFVIAYLDRVNLSYAQLQMKGDYRSETISWESRCGNLLSRLLLLEIPGSILVEKWSARGWIARIMITWGIVAIAMGFIQTKNQFYVLRFVLGAAEAGFFQESSCTSATGFEMKTGQRSSPYSWRRFRFQTLSVRRFPAPSSASSG